MTALARTTLDDAARSALNCFCTSSPADAVVVAIARAQDTTLTADGVETAVRRAVATFTPPLDDTGLKIGFLGCDSSELRYVIEGVRKK